MELITVIAVIVILVGLTVGILSSAQTKSGVEQTKGQMALIKSCLEQYKEEYGEYPPSTATNGDDTEGAKVLYQALTGDGDSLLGGENGSNGKLEREEIDGVKRWIDPENDPQGLIGKDKGSDFVLRDGFGNAWQYRTYDKNNPSATNNTSYDLWSFSTDKTHDDEAKWIRNW